MNILAIDIGSYSIKFLEVELERKNLVLINNHEIILDDEKANYPHVANVAELQKELVNHFIEKQPHDLKIIFQLPSEMLTTRYFEIPGTSKRKIELMIPFQLDDNLPYALSNAHFSSRLHKNSAGFSILANITQLSLFKEFFSYFDDKDSKPSILTSEISIIQAYIDHIRMNDTCCILDLGHKTTKAYHVQSRKIVSNHTSFVAGSVINEMIAKTYQIPHTEAVAYKHENAFLLTDEQLNEVSPEQKEFALLMKKVFNPLILDIKRWEMGHRVKFGTGFTKIYILGGTSKINGVENFLHYHTGFSIEVLPLIVDLKNDYSLHDNSLYLVKMMALAQKTSNNIINFLTGNFQTPNSGFISLHSAVFIIIRSTLIALLFILAFSSERFFFLTKQEKTIDSKIMSLLKTPALEVSRKDQKLYLEKPENVLAIFKKKNKIIKDEVNTILSSNSINALRPLAVLSKTLTTNPHINLEKISNDGFKVNAEFSSEDANELINLSKRLNEMGLPSLKVNYSPGKNNLTIVFVDRE